MSIMVALCLTACGEESKEKNNDKAETLNTSGSPLAGRDQQPGLRRSEV